MNPAEALIKFLRNKNILESDPDPTLLSALEAFPIWALSRKNLINEMEAIHALGVHLGIEYLDLDSPRVVEKLQVEQLANKIAGKLCWKARLLPVYEDAEKVSVVCANPFEQEAITSVEFIFSKPIKLYLGEESKIAALLAKYFPQQVDYEERSGEEREDDLDLEGVSDDVQALDHPNHSAPPVVRLTSKILMDAIKLDASDIHLEPNDQNMAVRFRIDGMMQDIITIPKRIQKNVVARIKVLSGMDISERRRPQDGRLRVTTHGQRLDMRVSTIPASSGEKVVLRLLRADYESMTFAMLGMPEALRPKLEMVLNRKGKLFLVSGPTGSGKTTTLYTALNYLRDGTTNITTIEDPIEYKFQHINQIQVNHAAEVSFASILRAVLRQDPDIVMIGEIRDQETINVVMQAAQTGHLVLSTVHTNDAPSVVTRLHDLGADRFSISTNLAGVLAQRLVRAVCENCKAPATESDLKPYRQYLEHYEIDPEPLMVGKGCANCFFSGYRGRRGIYSYLEITDDVSELIYSGESQDKLSHAARRHGFLDLDEAGVQLLAAGITTFAEVQPYLDLDRPRGKPAAEAAAAPPPPAAAVSTGVQELRITLDAGGVLAHSGASQPAASSAHLLRPRVLLVDDNKSVRRMLSALLAKEMVEVDEAADGIQALSKVYERPPSVVVCDLQMPEMDGKEFLRKMKSNRATRDIPIIMLTIDDSEQNEVELLDQGVCEFLSKHSSPLVLVSRIRRVLGAL